jgi:cytochrome oxidase Cu insertion factor (SCO1/SenC/PrrC family)
MTTRTWLAVAAALAAAVGIGVAFWVEDRPLPPPEISGYLLTEPRTLPAVELVDENDERFEPARFAGHWSFVYFGYTYCPDVCPLALLELAAVKERLAAGSVALPIEYYLVSVDPKRDTPARLRSTCSTSTPLSTASPDRTTRWSSSPAPPNPCSSSLRARTPTATSSATRTISHC